VIYLSVVVYPKKDIRQKKEEHTSNCSQCIAICYMCMWMSLFMEIKGSGLTKTNNYKEKKKSILGF
jgi:hypothetical protein